MSAANDEWSTHESAPRVVERIDPREREIIELAVAYVRERQYKEALRYFERVTVLTPEALSFYGMALAMSKQRLAEAVAYCRQAIEREPVRGEFYYHLGQTYLAFGEKREAVRTFKMGLQAEPRHPRLVTILKKLGVRHRCLVGFLRRDHPVNKYLGKARHGLKRTG